MSTTGKLLNTLLEEAWQRIFKSESSHAIELAKQASQIAPDSPEVAHVLGVIASRDYRHDIALPLLQKALDAEVTERRLRDMAEALLLSGHAQAALAPVTDCIKRFGSSPEAHGLLAAIQTALNQFDAAENNARKAVALKPHLMAWDSTVAFCQLMQLQIASGFAWFTGRAENLTANSRCPALQFAQPCEIYLKNEEGPGDTLFYLRFAAHLVQQGFRLHLKTDKKTKALLNATGLFASVKEDLSIPHGAFWLNMGDLPLAAIQRGCEPIAEALPLTPDPARVAKMQKKLSAIGPAPYVAVTWRAGARGRRLDKGIRRYHKHIDPEAMGALFADKACTIISVQRVPEPDEKAAFRKGLGREFADFSTCNDQLQDMLALMSLVDDYVTVPNTNVHIRQSLRKPMRVLVNQPWQDWRWLPHGNSPWYPNAEVYRQSDNGDWHQALQAVTESLFGECTSKQEPVEITAEPPLSPAKQAQQSERASKRLKQALMPAWEHLRKRQLPEAIKIAQAQMAEHANHPDLLHLLGWAAHLDLKTEMAIQLLKQAHAAAPEDKTILANLARVLTHGRHYDEAERLLAPYLASPNISQQFALLPSRAYLYLQQNRFHEAIADYEAYLKYDPNHLEVSSYLGSAKLKVGHANSGFKFSTARREARLEGRITDYVCPSPYAEYQNAKVLIKRDMGLGDELTFLRYLPWLTEAGGEVTYWAGKKLAPVLKRLDLAHCILADDQPAPNSDAFDISFWVNELPIAVQHLGAPDIAPPLVLNAREDLIQKWSAWLASLGPGPYIGFNWRAGAIADKTALTFGKLSKEIDPAPFAKALSCVQGTFISLQRNVMLSDLRGFEQLLQAPVHDAAGLTDDLEDLIALLSLLDENIGVSNTNMHLRAGLGLGSRVLVQNPGGDWRWGYEGAGSLWFEGSKVYRQDSLAGWDPSLQKLEQDLIQKYGRKLAATVVKTQPTPTGSPTKRIIWVSAGKVDTSAGQPSSVLASTRYRVIQPSLGLLQRGWQSSYVYENEAQLMGGWQGQPPAAGDTVVISKVFTPFAIKLAEDTKARGAKLIVDYCDNHLDHPQRGPVQLALLQLADVVVASTAQLNEALGARGRPADYVISDPVELTQAKPCFAPSHPLKLLWFGHAVNIDTLRACLPGLAQYAKQQPLTLTVVTQLPNGAADLATIVPTGLQVTYVAWSAEATKQAIQECDLVIIPTLSTELKNAKSPNRLLEPLWAGRMVVAGRLPAYEAFADSAWVGEDIIQGITWCLEHPQAVIERIALGQQAIQSRFSPDVISGQWQDCISNPPPGDKPMSNSADHATPVKEVAILTTQSPALPSIAIRLIEPLGMLEHYSARIASGLNAQNKLQIDFETLQMRKIIIVQRDAATAETLPLIRKLKQLGKTIIYETDDAFHLLPENHPKAFHRAKAPAMMECAQMADVITVSTQALANEFAAYGHVEIIPNMLSPKLWQAEPKTRSQQTPTSLRIGLVGGANHRDDFALINSAIATIAAIYPGVTWVAYGESAVNLMSAIPACACFESYSTNYHYPTHAKRLAQLALDIALVPLEGNPFNRCISNLKFLEFGFLGVPAVFSNVESYNTSVVDGETGLLVNNSTDSWVKAIQTLIDNPTLREQIGANAQKEVQTNWMLTSQNNGWQALLEKLA
ncbi:tetratricopeptide repeat protein [Methylophilus sp. TWE2]|uniref:tetratricopeptide repeat protein n=1 Tax=Methylophilus sp. TWE2 TaxID=1662285 RepID=UPI000670D889|nr:tetratricopeptide repeat protein [Methylophilus sp. TWE2]AKR42919.1 hypothetical protein ACJ67_05425 [Methylophilus sp. TWE2]